ncbi:MAG: hypothetical protein WCO06_06500, partial [Candidatus Roizmanbacteria bacterium]
LDIESKTQQQLLNNKTILEKAGFNQLKEGDTIHFVYKVTDSEKKSIRFTAERYLVIPQEYFLK